jgi:hypothetical protein
VPWQSPAALYLQKMMSHWCPEQQGAFQSLQQENIVSINSRNNSRRSINLPSKDCETTDSGKMAERQQNQPSYILYSAKISHLISTNLAAIAAL